MKFKKNMKKGFTLVELIVVIAIVAILAAVSVVSYIAFINSANESADIQLVKQLNIALQADESLNGKRSTMHEMLGAMEDNGFVVENLTKTKSGYDIVWDQEHNRFGLLNGDSLVYGESTYNSSKAWNIWKFADTEQEVSQETSQEDSEDSNKKYSVYLTEEFAKKGVTELTVNAGLDVGNYNKLTSIKYENTSNEQEVVIRTNNIFGKLTINAIHDEVDHYGDIGDLNIIAVKKGTYDEYGRVGGVATLTYGKINVKENAEITTIVGTAENSSDIELVVEDGGVVGTVISSDSDILDVLAVNGVNNAEEIDEGQIETVINSKCYIKGETNVYYSKIQDAINAADGTTTIVITKDVLYENITGAALTIPQGKDITLELNGKIIQAYLTNSASSQLISLGGASHTQKTYLTIKDSTAPIGGVGTGMLYVLNSFESDPMNVATSVISANPMAYVTIKSGKIYNACTNSNSSMGYGMYGIDVLTNGGTGKDTTLIVDGGLVQSKNYRSIRGFCNATGSSVKITINGGSVVSDGNNAIWLQNPNSSQNKAELRINGGKIIAGPNGNLPVNGAAASSNFDVKYSGGQFFFGTQNIFYTYGYFNDNQFTDYYYGTVWGTIEDCENLGYYVVASEKYSGYYDVYYTPGMCVNAANEFVVEGKEFVKISEGLYEIR